MVTRAGFFGYTEGLVQRFLSTQELQDTFGSIDSKQRQAMDDFIDNIAQL